ncbi:hypothetical protein Ancab_039434 [Ancistrocladus abbreviatus]
MGAVSVARYLLVIVLIHGLLLSQTSFTLTGVIAAARLEPSSESGTPYNISARVSKDPPPPSPRPQHAPLQCSTLSIASTPIQATSTTTALTIALATAATMPELATAKQRLFGQALAFDLPPILLGRCHNG